MAAGADEAAGMSLLLRARWRATLHWWQMALRWPPQFHRIWRIYRYAGLDTLAIGCECGIVFGVKR